MHRWPNPASLETSHQGTGRLEALRSVFPGGELLVAVEKALAVCDLVPCARSGRHGWMGLCLEVHESLRDFGVGVCRRGELRARSTPMESPGVVNGALGRAQLVVGASEVGPCAGECGVVWLAAPLGGAVEVSRLFQVVERFWGRCPVASIAECCCSRRPRASA